MRPPARRLGLRVLCLVRLLNTHTRPVRPPHVVSHRHLCHSHAHADALRRSNAAWVP